MCGWRTGLEFFYTTECSGGAGSSAERGTTYELEILNVDTGRTAVLGTQRGKTGRGLRGTGTFGAKVHRQLRRKREGTQERGGVGGKSPTLTGVSEFGLW